MSSSSTTPINRTVRKRKGKGNNIIRGGERYIGKSDPFIVMVSTPNGPGGIMEWIEKEPVESCMYKRYSFTIPKESVS
jgi:hypothetical protein